MSDYISTKDAIQRFKESLVWRDVTAELKDILIGLHNELTVVRDLYELGRIQGRIQAIEWLIKLPDHMLTNKSTEDKNSPQLDDFKDCEPEEDYE